jgi:hypothetical protein
MPHNCAQHTVGDRVSLWIDGQHASSTGTNTRRMARDLTIQLVLESSSSFSSDASNASHHLIYLLNCSQRPALSRRHGGLTGGLNPSNASRSQIVGVVVVVIIPRRDGGRSFLVETWYFQLRRNDLEKSVYKEKRKKKERIECVRINFRPSRRNDCTGRHASRSPFIFGDFGRKCMLKT